MHVRIVAALACALALAVAPARALAQTTVELRHHGGTLAGRIVAEDADGITLEVAGTPPVRTFVRWDLVQSAVGGAAPPSRASRLALGESIWRGRVRLDRGDAASAEPLLEAAVSTLSREGGALSLAAWEELMRARIALGGELADAAARVPSLRAAVRDTGDLPVALPARPDPVDSATGLVAAAPPAWATRAEATRAREGFASIAASSRDVALVAQLYAQIAAADAGDAQPPPPRGARPVGSPPPPRGALARGVEILEAWAAAVSSDAEARRRGRDSLRRMARELSPAMRAWAIYAGGRSLSMEPDPKQRRMGATEMLKAAAAHGALAPILERAAVVRAAEALDAAGDSGSASALRAHAGPRDQQYSLTEILATPQPALVATDVRGREVARVEEDEARALADFLERAGLDDLFAMRLEEELSRAASPAGASRACEVLERLFAAAGSAQRVADLRVRVEYLVARDRLPCMAALRLAAARAEYRLAGERIAALRRGDERALQGNATRDEASALLDQCGESLSRLEQSLSAELTQLRMRAGGSDEVARTEALAISELVAAQLLEVRYLRAWSRFGSIWLARSGADPASVAAQADALVPSWGELLETGKAFPSPDDVSVDLRGEEYYASSILGLAMTKALAAGLASAEPWFELLREPGVWSGTSGLEQAMRLESAIDCGAYDAATSQVRDIASSMTDDAIAGCALRAMREARGEASAPAGGFARACFESLVARGSLSSAQRLAARVPALARGDGFAPRLAAALAVVVRAKAIEDRDRAKPVLEEAARALSTALAAPDAGESPSAPSVRALRGLVLASAGDPCQASESLASASAQLAGERADEAAWLAARLSDEGRCTVNGLPTARDLWLDYLRRFPDGAHANGAMVALARFDEVLDPVLAERLLEVPAEDPVSAEAARAAARIYYRLARSAVGDARADPVRRLFLILPSAAASWPDGWIDPVARQQLEFALDPSAARLELARGLLAEIASRYPPGGEPEPYRAELATRRLELALLDRQYAAAAAELERVRAAGDRAWLMRADALFARDVEAMLASEAESEGRDAQQRSEAARALVSARRGVLETARREGNPERADAAAIGLARALLAVDAKANAAEAAGLARDVLVRKPSHRPSLEVAADAAVAGGQARAARDALVTLLSVLAPTSLERPRRQCQLVEILAANDPDEARKVLAQLQVFDPTWGPAPWGERLKALARSLGMQVEETEPLPDGAGRDATGGSPASPAQPGGAR